MKNNLVLKSIKSVVLNNIFLFIFLLFVIVAVVMFSLIPPQILRILIDEYLLKSNSSGLLNIAVIYLIALIFIGVFDFLKEGFLLIIGQKISKEIRMEMMYKLERINAIYFSGNDSGMIVSRFINDVDTINSMFTSGIIGMIIDCFKVIGIVMSIWIFNPSLGILTFVMLPLIYAITRIFQKLMLKAQIKNRMLVGKVNNHISESLKNVRMIKAFSKEKYMEDKYKDYLFDNFETVEKVNYYDSIYPPIIQLIRAIAISVIVILSSKDLNLTGITLGMIAASIDLISNLFAPIENLGMELQSIQSSLSGIKRVNDFYAAEEDDTTNTELTVREIIPDRNDISINFTDISFSYDTNVPILENINLSVNQLQKIAFIGRTGVGKSTLFNLITGLYRPTSGSITINGFDVYSIPNSEKRNIFGYVNQGFSFIQGTIYDQISLNDDKINTDSVHNAMQLVGLHDYVMSLEHGYDTPIDRNNIFSQGQKQLLSIARALASNPPILLLDEITANLDSVTEEKIISVLQKVSYSRTILSISHRLSSMVSCDKIVLLEKGKIKNTGTPEELFINDDWYKRHLELEKNIWA